MLTASTRPSSSRWSAKARDTQLGLQPLAGLGRGIGDADQFAVSEAGIFLGVKTAEVSGANDGAAQSRHAGIQYSRRDAGLPRRGREARLWRWPGTTRSGTGTRGSRPPGVASCGLAALWLAFGLVAMPFLIYLAGVLTLGPYEGGLLAFLGSLLAAFFTLKLTAWLLVLGPLSAVHRRAPADPPPAPGELKAHSSSLSRSRLFALLSRAGRNSLPARHSGQVVSLATRAPTSNSRRRSSIEPLTSQSSEYSSPGL